ncbi:hypothetical protein DPEC_G00002680 [Dallia pectoralis]|uniref:Uncharacterized protein n=1 Tax=Dallia pectoralis TaxID=75939 RepID=A0ACC2HJZ6_DALPE|nr:hypothetical protein DPEC_G00002680 [Dallia pectoralis]
MVSSSTTLGQQQALLAAISEKDANIALLELSSSKRKKSQDEVMALKREKDRLMHQLKQQTTMMKNIYTLITLTILSTLDQVYTQPMQYLHHINTTGALQEDSHMSTTDP